MIGIICAMQSEMEKIHALIPVIGEEEISGIHFYKGEYQGQEIVTAICGIGKVFAAMCAQTMILTYHPEMVLNVGVAGSLSTKLSIADIAIASDLVEHDMDTSAIGDPKGLISGINIINLPCDAKIVKEMEEAVAASGIDGIKTVTGTIASGDQFIANPARKEEIIKDFGAIACEMEGAAIGQVCYVNKVPCCVIRAISDSADNSSHMDYPEFVKIASANSAKVIVSFLDRRLSAR